MGDNSAIEWTDATWNPVRGCSIVSKGCTNCYAMRQAHRHAGAGGAYEDLTKMTRGGPVWTGKIREIEDLLLLPLKWKRPRRIFVNSMSDLFHEGVHGDFIDAIIDTIDRCEHLGLGHKFQVLTKRAERMQRFMQHYKPRPNLWLGVSVEDQAAADERIPFLLQTPAAVRWISAEPLLGLVDLRDVVHLAPDHVERHAWRTLDWVVAGGESGPGARPMHPDWARALRDQCSEFGIPFFFKQWGAYGPACDYYDDDEHRDAALDQPHELLTREGWRWRVGTPGTDEPHDGQPPAGTWVMHRVSKKVAGRNLDGRTHDEYPA